MSLRSLGRRKFLMLFLSSSLLPLESLCAKPKPTRFTVYDSLHYSDKPDIGMPRVIVNGSQYFRDKDHQIPNESACRSFARWAAKNFDRAVIDIEHWKIDIRNADKKDVQHSIDRILQIIAWMKLEQPELPLGVYAYPPIRDYWTLVRKDAGALADWHKANDFLRPIAERADFLAPSIYTFYEDVEGWKTYAAASIAEAKRFNKPVLPFLWCKYHVSNKALKETYLPGAYWMEQLQTVQASGADGVILWDSGGGKKLDTQWEWWQKTAEFVKSLPKS